MFLCSFYSLLDEDKTTKIEKLNSDKLLFNDKNEVNYIFDMLIESL